MSVGSNERVKRAKAKVRELHGKGHRLNRDAASQTYKDVDRQSRMGRGTGHAAERVLKENK